MRKDSSKRTTRIVRYYRITIAACCSLVLSVLMIAGGMMSFDNVVKHSSTAIGTSMKFQRSNATVKVNDLYTDETNSVLIVRLTATDEDFSKLPFKGSDYDVYLKSSAFSGLEQVSVLFGKFSTDGDMFLVIPKPNKDIYSIAIMNTKYVAGSVNSSSSSSSSSSSKGPQSLSQEQINPSSDKSAVKKSLTNALSSYKYDDSEGQAGVIQLKSDQYDWIAFRVTLDPAFKDDPAYKVKILPGTLLDDNGDFDFEGFFNKAFKNASMDALSAEYTELESQKSLLNSRKAELEERLDVNPDDTSATNGLDETKKSIEKLESQQLSIVEQLNLYEKVTYSPSYFQNLQTTATVVS